jgi:multiple sugar transport system substrate-binding protein
VLAAAEAIRAAGIMENPIVMNMQVGWNIAELFNIIYMAMAVNSSSPARPIPAINSEAGVATLEMMARSPNTPIPTT